MNYLNKKTVLIIFLGIVCFLAIYLPYVKKMRQESIDTFFSHPQVGDIYKFSLHKRGDGITTFYYKIKDIGKESIYFYPGNMSGAYGQNDAILGHYNTDETEVLTKKELQEIRNGKNDMALLEIVRK